jgi:hypothetical protein
MSATPKIRKAFEESILVIRLDELVPTKVLPKSVLLSTKYARIARSVAEEGLVEPLVVARGPGGKFQILDGHARFSALLGSGATDARCLVALEDEAFTYNKRISHLATIQEHYMIVRALEKGVPEERLAASLNVDVALIRQRRSLLDGICPEVVDVFKTRPVNVGVFSALRKMKPLRQIEAVELMTMAGNVTVSYAKVLLAGTRPADLINPERVKKTPGMTPEQMDRMQREMEAVQSDFKTVEKAFGPNVLQLVVATGYVSSLIQNAHVQRYLEDRHPEYLTQFRSIVRATSLDPSQP